MKKIFKDRYVLLGLFIVICVIVIVAQLFNLQVVKGEQYFEESQRGLLQERSIKAPRGEIMDRNGVPVAVNRMGFTVQISYIRMKSEERNSMILDLINILENNNEQYVNDLYSYLEYDPLEFGYKIKDSQEKIFAWADDIGLEVKKNRKATPEYIFECLKKKYKINGSYSLREAYVIMAIKYTIQIRGYSIFRPLCIARDISWKTVAEIEERHHELPGVTTDWEPFRRYIDGYTIAHVLGYIRGIDPEEYRNLKEKGYGYNDLIGKTGVEKASEEYLRGTDGLKRIEVNTKGRFIQTINWIPVKPGKDVVLTIDMRLQKAAMDSLKGNIDHIRQKGGKNNYGDANAGAVVAIDVNSGEVLAMVSYPSYDPSVFLPGSDKASQKKIMELNTDVKDRPLLNRPVQGLYAPGSTFKPITAIAGLEEGVITPEETIRDEGIMYIDGMKFECLEYRWGLGAHGDLTLKRALATSCNIFFHKLGVRTGIDMLDKWARLFGLGEKTGIEIPGEYKGNRNNREYKKKVEDMSWFPADTAQAAIGQLYNQFTPLQLANYVSSIANGGKRYTPHLIKKIIKKDGSIVMQKEPEYEQIPVKTETINAVKKGMIAVTNSIDGTAVTVFDDLPFKVAGKTGTAETGRAEESSNGLFVCYAPAQNPQIAVAVVVEKGAWGSNTAPVARDVLKEYFELYETGDTINKAEANEVIFTR